jgi:hypothetical protein
VIKLMRIVPGEDEIREFEIVGEEVDGYTARATFTVGSETVELDTDNGIVVDAVDDVIRIHLTDEQTLQLGSAGWFGRAEVWATDGDGIDVRLVRAALIVL